MLYCLGIPILNPLIPLFKFLNKSGIFSFEDVESLLS